MCCTWSERVRFILGDRPHPSNSVVERSMRASPVQPDASGKVWPSSLGLDLHSMNPGAPSEGTFFTSPGSSVEARASGAGVCDGQAGAGAASPRGRPTRRPCAMQGCPGMRTDHGEGRIGSIDGA